MSPLRVGIINLPIFYKNSEHQWPRGLVRHRPFAREIKTGGYCRVDFGFAAKPGRILQEAIGITGLFIPAGPVVQTRDATGRVEVEASPGTNEMYAGPLVVLTSRLSASSSEIVAGALQDYGRALIVGDPTTFGKGTVQNIVRLKKLLRVSGCGAVKVTVAKFYRPGGASTQLKGVLPDIVLPSETDVPGIGEARLPNALPWDSVPSATYTNLNLVRPVLSKLRDKSRVRVAANPGFRLLWAELAASATEESQPLSLNESARSRENASADKLKAELHRFCLADSARRPRTYDLNMANVAAEGLPPPRQPATPTEAATQSTDNDPSDDIELRETENILADYIESLRAVPRQGFAEK